MPSGTLRVRSVAEVWFFLCIFAGFYWNSAGNVFCNKQGLTGRVHQSFHVAVVFTLWDSLACVAALAVAHWSQDPVCQDRTRLWISGAVAALGYFAAPSFLNPQDEARLFHNVLNCSCFFTEQFGMVFPQLAAPLLTIATILREGLIQRVLQRMDDLSEE